MVRPPRLIFAELKAEKGNVTPAQEEWLLALGRVGDQPEVYIWRPSNWDDLTKVLSR